MPTEEERTTPDGPSAFRQILDQCQANAEQLGRVEDLVTHLSNNVFAMNSAYARLETTVASHTRLLQALELRERWIPFAFSALSLACSVFCVIWCLVHVQAR